MENKAFDVVVIGAGSAGFSAAEAAREKGVSVCLVEQDKLGGECPNWACVPTKALLKAAKVFRESKRSGDYGIIVRRVEYDFGAVMAYKDKVVTALTGGGEFGKRYERIASDLGVEVVHGVATFTDANTIVVTYKGAKTTLRAKAFVIATGSVEFVPEIPGLQEAGFLSFHDAVSLKKAPASLIIIGGGPVGCEFATFFGSFGIPTTIVQMPSIVLHREDGEIAELAGQALQELGVHLITGAITHSVTVKGKMKELEIEVNGVRQVIQAETLLVATGKRANVSTLNLGAAKVKLTALGNIATSDTQVTSTAHIFAAGDVIGGMQFTSTAHHEGTVAGANAAFKALGKTRGFEKSDLSVVPRVTFIEPDVASVGMTEDQVRSEFGAVVVGKFPLSALGRSVTDGVKFGWLKIVAHPQTMQVLGGHMIGQNAGEVIHEIALAVKLQATLQDLGGLIHAFPTFSEAIAGASSNVTRIE